jgi:hypothetical protein
MIENGKWNVDAARLREVNLKLLLSASTLNFPKPVQSSNNIVELEFANTWRKCIWILLLH